MNLIEQIINIVLFKNIVSIMHKLAIIFVFIEKKHV